MKLPKVVIDILGKEEDIELAKIIIQNVKKGPFVSSLEFRQVIIEKNSKFTEDRYYKVLKILQNMGMLKKKGRTYSLDYLFVTNFVNDWIEMIFGEE